MLVSVTRVYAMRKGG